jgi:hypothetical protein
MSAGFMLTPEEMRDAHNVSAESLATRCGIDTNGPLADDTRSEVERVRAVRIQVVSQKLTYCIMILR